MEDVEERQSIGQTWEADFVLGMKKKKNEHGDEEEEGRLLVVKCG